MCVFIIRLGGVPGVWGAVGAMALLPSVLQAAQLEPFPSHLWRRMVVAFSSTFGVSPGIW